MAFERALIEEIAGLERELEADPRFQKLSALRLALVHYRPLENGKAEDRVGSAVEPTQAENASTSAIVQKPERRGGRQRDPERQRMLDEAVNYIHSHPGRPDTGSVYSHLIDLGFFISGQNPQGNLSAALYKEGRLISHGRGGGWSVKHNRPNGVPLEDFLKENEPHDAGASHGSDAELEDPEVRTMIYGD